MRCSVDLFRPSGMTELMFRYIFNNLERNSHGPSSVFPNPPARNTSRPRACGSCAELNHLWRVERPKVTQAVSRPPPRRPLGERRIHLRQEAPARDRPARGTAKRIPDLRLWIDHRTISHASSSVPGCDWRTSTERKSATASSARTSSTRTRAGSVSTRAGARASQENRGRRGARPCKPALKKSKARWILRCGGAVHAVRAVIVFRRRMHT